MQNRIHEDAIKQQGAGLAEITLWDPHLRRLEKEWRDNEAYSLLTFGAFLNLKLCEDWTHAHHWGFRQGVESALSMRDGRVKSSRQKDVPIAVLVFGMLVGALGVAMATPYILSPENAIWVRWCAVFLACPMLFIHGACSLYLVSRALPKSEEEQYVNPVEFDPFEKAAYLEKEEQRAVRDFLEKHRSMGTDDTGRDL